MVCVQSCDNVPTWTLKTKESSWCSTDPERFLVVHCSSVRASLGGRPDGQGMSLSVEDILVQADEVGVV